MNLAKTPSIREQGGAESLSPPTRVSRRVLPRTGTTTLEKLLLALIIVVLPLEHDIVLIPEVSTLYLLFAALALYVLLRRPSALLGAIRHPVFLAAYVFLGFGFLMELTHDHASVSVIIRTFSMFAGAVLVASVCRDLPALKAACWGYLIAGLWMSMVLFLTSYGVLTGATALNFDEASLLRTQAFEENPLKANLNGMALVASQGAVVALVSVLTARTILSRSFFLAIGSFCLVGGFLSLSRGGAATVIISCASVLYAFGLRQGKVILIAALLGSAIFMWVPTAVWSRMTFSTEAREGVVEGRARVYTAAIKHFPEYVTAGVGAGNFWSTWGLRSDFAKRGNISGAHNCFLQVTLYWGIGGLITFLFVFWQAYRSIPRYCGREAASLCLLGISVSLLLLTMLSHNIYLKEFSLGLGLLVGAHCWIWPSGIVEPLKRKDRA